MEHSTVSIHEAGSETMRKCMYFKNFNWLLNLLCSWRSGRCQKVNMGAKTLKEVRQNNKKSSTKYIYVKKKSEKRVTTERKGEKGKGGLTARGGGGWSRQERIQQWRQWPENNMPNPGSHFLLHRRLLWNSSSMANVTRSRERWRERLHTPPSPIPSHFLLWPAPLP